MTSSDPREITKQAPSPKFVGTLFLILTLLSLVATLAFDRYYWGYYWRRPELDRRVLNAKQVLTVSQVETERKKEDSIRFELSNGMGLRESIEIGKLYPYDSPDLRTLVGIATVGMLPTVPKQLEQSQLENLYTLVQETKLLDEGADGFQEAKILRGVVIEFLSPKNENFLSLSLRGGEVKRDHFPYYEFLFRASDAPGALGKRTLVSFKKFYFDIASVEGLEGTWLFIGLVLMSNFLVLFSVYGFYFFSNLITAWIRKVGRPRTY